jgi:hypothetical protein
LDRKRDQRAGALLAEFGYQLPELWAQPWLRVGVNWGSGDSDLEDGNRSTFFNILPTNSLYYNYTDQLALQNLVDLLVQLKLAPVSKFGVELIYHRFWLSEKNDFRWGGTGAFSRENLGYVASASNGSSDVADGLDVNLTYQVDSIVALRAGFSKLWGGEAFNRGNVSFAYAQVVLNY